MTSYPLKHFFLKLLNRIKLYLFSSAISLIARPITLTCPPDGGSDNMRSVNYYFVNDDSCCEVMPKVFGTAEMKRKH